MAKAPGVGRRQIKDPLVTDLRKPPLHPHDSRSFRALRVLGSQPVNAVTLIVARLNNDDGIAGVPGANQTRIEDGIFLVCQSLNGRQIAAAGQQGCRENNRNP
jgi:hypothetical protein